MCSMSASVLRVGKLCLLAGFAAFLFTRPANAQFQIDADAPDVVGDQGPSDNWRYTLGLGAAAVPDYQGSEDYRAAPLPIARAQKGFQYGQLFGSKVTSNLVPHPNFRAGLVASYISKRDDVDNNQVDNLKTVDQALMLGGLVGYDLDLNGGTLGFEVEWTHDVIDGNDGWLLQPEIKYRRKLAEDWRLNVSTTLTYASEDYMESYFSITPADSARSGLPTYNASDGFKDVGMNLALTYSFTDHWGVGGLVGYKRLLNDAEDSPVTKVGDENQYIAGLFLTYSWQGGN